MTDEPKATANANRKLTHVATAEAFAQGAGRKRGVLNLCGEQMTDAAGFDSHPFGFEKCPTCYDLKRGIELERGDAAPRFVYVRAAESVEAPTEGAPLALEIESDEAAAPPVEAPPLALSVEALGVDDDSEPTRGEDSDEARAATEAVSKKATILDLWENQNVRDIAEIVRRVKARPSYVAQVLQQAGHLDGYFDLYSQTGREQNVYTRYFRNVLHFRDEEAARESVKRIDRLFNYFERLGDRAGAHQAMILALTGYNRARWSGKLEESRVFKEWLDAH
jgi:hypothetical protein